MSKIQKAFAKRTPVTVNSVVVTPSSGTIIEKVADLPTLEEGEVARYVLVDINAQEVLDWLNSTSNGKTHGDPAIAYTNSEYIYACDGLYAMSNTVATTAAVTAAVKAEALALYDDGGVAGLAALEAFIGYEA